MSKPAVILILLVIFLPINSYSQQRTLEISGLKIYTEDELFSLLNLEEYEKGKMSAKEVTDSLIAFYSSNGFTLVKIYVVENSDIALKIYIDEGALGKIIFLNMDDFTTLYFKISFRLKHKIFNYYAVQEKLDKLKTGKRWKDITWQLKPVKEYDKSFFQLDRELDLPLIGKKVLPFFDRYSPQYDLIIIFSKYINPYSTDDKIIDKKKLGAIDKKGGADQKIDKKNKKPVLNRVDYGLRVNYYKGFIPYLRYYHLGLIAPGDFFMGDTSVGIMYGLDRKFTKPPRETYFSFSTNYFFPPTFKEIFTPLIKADLLQSKAARPDLNLLSYNYLLLNAMLAPGITILSKFNLYFGYGVETAFIFHSTINKYMIYKYDPYQVIFGSNTAQDIKALKDLYSFYRQVNDHTDVYNYLEAGFLYDFSKKRTKIYELHKNRLKKEIALIYDFYFLYEIFNKIRLLGIYEHEFKDRSIYSVKISYQYCFGETPFYHEASVSNLVFKGFQRTSYFSKNALSQSNEYRISVYKDFLYVGAYFDMTVFEGSGRDVKGAQFGIVGGPTMRVLLMDHFELYLQYGWDYLFSNKNNGGYLYFNIYNKW
jgi:hypothetical protein